MQLATQLGARGRLGFSSPLVASYTQLLNETDASNGPAAADDGAGVSEWESLVGTHHTSKKKKLYMYC